MISTAALGSLLLPLTPIKKIKKNVRNLVNNNGVMLEFFRLQTVLIDDVITNQFLFLSGKLSITDFISIIVEKKLKFETLNNNTQKEIDSLSNQNNGSLNSTINLLKTINVTSNLYILYFNNFLTNFFESTKKDSLASKLSFDLALCYYGFCNNL